jgi:hypothetical protein
MKILKFTKSESGMVVARTGEREEWRFVYLMDVTFSFAR